MHAPLFATVFTRQSNRLGEQLLSRGVNRRAGRYLLLVLRHVTLSRSPTEFAPRDPDDPEFRTTEHNKVEVNFLLDRMNTCGCQFILKPVK
jgi:hypothetical protein